MQHYQTLDSLREVVLIAQDTRRLLSYTRQPDDTWEMKEMTAPDHVLPLESVGCVLRVGEVYAKVVFS